MNDTLTQVRLMELLEYNPETGAFIRKVTTSSNAKAGQVAGNLEAEGYLRIFIDRKVYKAHRLAWLYMHGSFPPECLDHIDGNKANNAIRNLRLATNDENLQNRHKSSRRNSTGFLGVSYGWRQKSWKAGIKVNGVYKQIGYFRSPEAAYIAYLKAKKQLHQFWIPSPEQSALLEKAEVPA